MSKQLISSGKQRGAHKNAKSKQRNAARRAERKAKPELRGRQWRGLAGY